LKRALYDYDIYHQLYIDIDYWRNNVFSVKKIINILNIESFSAKIVFVRL